MVVLRQKRSRRYPAKITVVSWSILSTRDPRTWYSGTTWLDKWLVNSVRFLIICITYRRFPHLPTHYFIPVLLLFLILLVDMIRYLHPLLTIVWVSPIWRYIRRSAVRVIFRMLLRVWWSGDICWWWWLCLRSRNIVNWWSLMLWWMHNGDNRLWLLIKLVLDRRLTLRLRWVPAVRCRY